MKIVITCGPSYEPIDGARRMTNMSTGKLGITLANALTDAGHEVVCLKGEGATCPDKLRAASVRSFTTNEDLAGQLHALSKTFEADAVLHAAALCDFKVARVITSDGDTGASKKISTRAGEVTLLLAPTFKVLPKLRLWFPRAVIVGWKYELAGTREDAFAAAWLQLRECDSDACVLNGAAYGEGFAVCEPQQSLRRCLNTTALAEFFTAWLEEKSPACVM
jgi:phosphopantothenoylcysteine decarboxylase/phosphopantothenate--cysteine ligase